MHHGVQQSAATLSERMRRSLWGRLRGAVWVGDARSVEDAIQIADLDWEVRLDGPLMVSSLGRILEVPRKQATVRTSPEPRVLGAVGPTYEIIQNRVALATLDGVVKAEQLDFFWAGEIKGGCRVFLVAGAPNALKVADSDFDLFYEVLTSHDESTSLRITLFPVHRASQTILSLKFPRAKRRVAIKHTANSGVHALSAAVAIREFGSYLDQFAKAADRLANQPISEVELRGILRRILKYRDEDNLEEVISEILAIFRHAEQTRWNAYVTIVNWVERRQPVRSGGVSPEMETVAMRSLYDNEVERYRTRAGEALLGD